MACKLGSWICVINLFLLIEKGIFCCSEDVLYMCQLLNMEEAGDELLEQLEVAHLGRISFSHFMQCRMRLLLDAEPDGRAFSSGEPSISSLHALNSKPSPAGECYYT
jgi:hypothetical protein